MCPNNKMVAVGGGGKVLIVNSILDEVEDD
jgi:hypothetical protein